VLYELTDDGRDLKPVLDAYARWGLRRLTRAGADEVVKPQWFVLSLAATVPRESLAAGTSYLLDIDNEQFWFEWGNATSSQPTRRADRVTATIAGKLRDFFAAAKGTTSSSADSDIGRSFGGQEARRGTDWPMR